MTEADGHDGFQSATTAFLDWLQSNGATVSSKIQLADLRQHHRGRGVLATEDMSEDEELFAVPRTAILTTETSSLPSGIKERFSDPWLSLITVMIHEYQQGSASAWEPYFAVLPSTFSTLMFWSERELEYLEGSAVADKIGKKSADEAFKNKVIPALRGHEETFKINDTSDEELLKLCHQMGSTIMAYAFDLEKPETEQQKPDNEEWEEDEEESDSLPKGLVPMADMLNADADKNNAKLYYEEDRVVMKSIKPIKAGEEIFNDYGPLPQADVLRRYGYTTKNYEKYDVVEISLDLIKSVAKEQQKLSEKDIADRTTYLEEQGALEDGYDIAHASNIETEQFPEDLRILLNILTASKEDFDKWKRKDKLPKPDLTSDSQSLLYTILVHRRADYYFDIAADDFPSVADDRRRDALSVVRGEKLVLQEAADAVQEQLRGTNQSSTGGKKRPMATFDEDSREVRKAAGKRAKHSEK
ncbi:hypothetical protein B0A50_07638 [Salinomyces thailandicus]|uniref:SET domain-containing protein n=1 Tax=Salinomyces thailandicus TaxID=706561 RepID=A0A4V5N389_9PEZI|nr:hypothetical protein B0A50_07638 [Salinomyces thailandica]